MKTKLIELTERLKNVTSGIQNYVRYGDKDMREVKYVLLSEYGTPKPFTNLDKLRQYAYDNLSRRDVETYEVFEINVLDRDKWVEGAEQKDNSTSVR